MGFQKIHHLSSLKMIFMMIIMVLLFSCCVIDSLEDEHGLVPPKGYNNNNNNDDYIHYLDQVVVSSSKNGHVFGGEYGSHDHRNMDDDHGKKLKEISYGLIKQINGVQVFSVDDFGAKGDGSTDDTKAFGKAWDNACSSNVGKPLLVPKGKEYLIGPITLSGPCKSKITFQIYGTIKASKDRSDYKEDYRHWIMFDGIQNLIVEGGGSGIINGNGRIWWQNSCKVDKSLPCKDAPTALTFYQNKNLIVRNLKIQDAQQMHVRFEDCVNVQASNLNVNAPGDSPNTDGIHVTRTKNIQITNSVIGTGDDCISIVTGSQNVVAKDITCGPGHGISIGSLGSGHSEAYVSKIVVNGAKLSGTTNGLRIKTWQRGSGCASNIKFQNIEMKNVTNPIIIDQNYCDQDQPCKQEKSGVQVKNVLYQNIKGTSESKVGIQFGCSGTHPCQDIVLQNVNLKSEEEEEVKAECDNAKVTQIGNVSPRCH